MSTDLVLFNMSRFSEWESGVVNRNFHVAQHLMSHGGIGKTLLIDQPPHSWQRLARIWWKERGWRPYGKILAQGPAYRLTELISGKRYHLMSLEALISEKRFLSTVQRSLQWLGFEQYLLWSYLPTYVENFRILTPQLSLFDAVDDWSLHPSYRKLWPKLREHYRILDERADLIFTVSEALKKRFPTHKRVSVIPNGVDVEPFQHPKSWQGFPLPKPPLLVYTGVIQERVDVDLLLWIAQQRPQYTILMVGPVWKTVKTDRLRSMPNIILAGFLPWQKLPSLLIQCTVGLVPHRSDPLVSTMNPLKVYEYIAAGIPVVAIHCQDFPDFHPGFTLVRSNQQFLDAVDRYVQQPPEPDTLQRLVKPHSWSARLSVMWEKITAAMQQS